MSGAGAILRAGVKAPVRRLGLSRNRRVVGALRELGVYAPLRVFLDGADSVERRHLADLREFRRRYSPILRGISTEGDEPRRRVLFPHMSPGLLRTWVDGVLAKGLQMHGCEPFFVIERNDLWHEDYLRGFGFRNLLVIEDYLPDAADWLETARGLLGACRTEEDVIGLVYDGVELGRHSASRVLKNMRRGSIDVADRELMSELERGLARSIVYLSAARRILAEVDPEILVTPNQVYTPWAEFYDAALLHGVDIIHWYRSQLEHSLLFRRYFWEDRRDVVFTISKETWEQLRQLPWSREDGERFLAVLRQSYAEGLWFERKHTLANQRLKGPGEVRAALGLDPAKKTAIVFSHILYDATFLYGTNLLRDYREWFVETARAAYANTRVNWVIKLHPENIVKTEEAGERYALENLEEYQLLRAEFGELPAHVKLMTPEDDTSTASLFDVADYAITVRGTVGLEFPCFGIPTLTAGTGGYSGRGFTIDSETAEEYLEKLAHVEEIPRLTPEQVALAQRFSHGVFQLKPTRIECFEWRRSPDKKEDWLSFFDFELKVRSTEELRRSRDLALFADWVLNSRRSELLGAAGTNGGGAWEPIEELVEASQSAAYSLGS